MLRLILARSGPAHRKSHTNFHSVYLDVIESCVELASLYGQQAEKWKRVRTLLGPIRVELAWVRIG